MSSNSLSSSEELAPTSSLDIRGRHRVIQKYFITILECLHIYLRWTLGGSRYNEVKQEMPFVLHSFPFMMQIEGRYIRPFLVFISLGWYLLFTHPNFFENE